LADGELDWPRARVFIDVLATTAAGVAEAVSPRVNRPGIDGGFQPPKDGSHGGTEEVPR
jgi:hypothetical protein